MLGQLSQLIVAKDNPSSLEHAARTAVVAIVSTAVAGLFGLPEVYWAPITAFIVMQSTLGTSLPISAQRFAGTAIGAAVGAATIRYVGGSLWAFGIDVFIIGVVCAILRIERAAYLNAGVTLAIVMLVNRSAANAWLIGLHRFFEVSIGTAVGLLLSALWPEKLKGTSR